MKERISSVFFVKGEGFCKSTFHCILNVISMLIYHTPKIAGAKRDILFSKASYEESEYVVNCCGAWGDKKFFLSLGLVMVKYVCSRVLN